jgi:hypothetical protein
MGKAPIAAVVIGLAGCGGDRAESLKPSGDVHDGGRPASADAGRDGAASDEAKLVMQPFTVEPGSEVYMCQSFSNPFGETVSIREFESHMSAGSHHLIVNYQDARPSSLAIEACSGLTPPSGPFATQVPDDRYAYQAGIGAPLPADWSLRLINHYLNTTSETISPTVVVTLRIAPPGTLVRSATMTTMAYVDIEIPPHQSATVSGYEELAVDEQILWLLPHMHSRGRHFTVTTGKANPVAIFETNDWESAPHRFDPPLLVRANDRIGYTCTWINDTSDTLVFGESAKTNEMCLLAYQYTTPETPP